MMTRTVTAADLQNGDIVLPHVRARSAAAGEPVRDDYIARRVAQILDPEQTGQSPADTRVVARERNIPPRPPHLTVVAPALDAPAQRTGDDQPAGRVADQVYTSRTAPVRPAGQGRNVVGFGVFDPTDDDWGFR